MRTSRVFRLYSFIFLLLSTFSAAWPWPKWLPELDALVVRDSSSSSTSASSTSASETASSTSGSASSTSSNNSNSKTSDSNNNPTTTATKTASFAFTDPAGAVVMQTPATISGAQYFKIGDFVTFGWNYTGIQATPTAIDIMATCTANQQLYTIATNQTFVNATGSVTWDTGAYQSTAVSDPLLTETYTLIIYDAASSISATAQPGYLAVYNQFTFGMYTPQPYTPLSDYQCATCSGALGDLERKALGMVVGMCVITVMSFSWFVGGTGVIW